MSQTVRMSGSMSLVDSTLNSQQTLLQRPLYEQARTTNLRVSNVQAVTTTAANLSMGSVTSPGIANLENLETDTGSATYISVGFDVTGTFHEAFRLGPTQFLEGPLSPTPTWQVKTNSSTGQIKYDILQRNP